MKSTTERRLLFALLVSSLAPLLALGFLAGAAVHRLGQALEQQALEARDAQSRVTLAAATRETAERIATFLRRREADLRALALIPRSPPTYEAFRRTSLGPLWAEAEDQPATRVWVPLYAEVCFVGLSGRERVRASDEPTRSPRPLRDLGQAPFFRTALGLASDRITITPAPEVAEGALRLAAASLDSAGGIEGVSALVLDPRHLETQLRDGEQPTGAWQEARQLFFFQDGETVLLPADVPASPALGRCVAQALPEAAKRVRSGETAALAPAETIGTWRAFAPIQLDDAPGLGAVPFGGVLLCAEFPSPAAKEGPRAMVIHTETRIGLLTLAATFGVALAALLVARRMAVPWVRLREKARAVSESGEEPGDQDELDEIVRSFDSMASRVATSAGLVRASEARLREFLEMSPDGIAVTDPEGRLLHFNQALCQMLRRPPTQLAAMDAEALWARPGDREAMLVRLRDGGRLRGYEVELVRGDGSVFPALLTVRLGHLAGAECLDVILRDISEWKEAQRRDREKTEALFRVYGELSQAHQALRRAYSEVEDQVRLKTSELRGTYEALQASDRVKTEFLMKMSHELRTPLNCIIGYSEALGEGLDGPVTGEQAESLERIAQSGRRLLRMIEDLLDLSRLEAGRLGIECTEVRVEEVLKDVFHQARTLVGGRPVRLELAVEESLPAVWADPDRLRQVLFNLLGNAVKFTDAGWVRVEAQRRDARSVTVCVRDTGPGIPPEFLGSVFEKFAQAPGTARTGAGLGLAISRDLVERMGGTIWAESTLGAGSCFGFSLPVPGTSGQLALPLERA